MNQPLETHLRAALRARADDVPAAAVARLTGLEYRLRTRRVRPPAALGALATAGAAAGAVAVISLSAGASSAFAGWTPTPTPPAPGQLAAAQASCERGQSPIAGLPLKLTDTRGPFTFAVYADSESSATCIAGPGFTSIAANVASSAVTVPAGQVLLSAEHRSDRAGQPFTFAEGRTGAGVREVTLTLDDGSRVQATVGGGWFVAWWPAVHQIKSAQLTTSTGTITQTFNLSPEIPCRAGACSGGSSRGGEVGMSTVVGGGGTGRGEQTGSFSGSQ
jgi:hypothetical protein